MIQKAFDGLILQAYPGHDPAEHDSNLLRQKVVLSNLVSWFEL